MNISKSDLPRIFFLSRQVIFGGNQNEEQRVKTNRTSSNGCGTGVHAFVYIYRLLRSAVNTGEDTELTCLFIYRDAALSTVFSRCVYV